MPYGAGVVDVYGGNMKTADMIAVNEEDMDDTRGYLLPTPSREYNLNQDDGYHQDA